MSSRKRRGKNDYVRATLELRPSAEQIDAARREGEKNVGAVVDLAIDQLRADARALETAAKVLDDIPLAFFPVPHKAETIQALLSVAAGMHIAAERMPDSREIPF